MDEDDDEIEREFSRSVMLGALEQNEYHINEVDKHM